MRAGHKITVEIPDELYEEISSYKEEAQILDEGIAVVRLLRYALTLPPYFRAFDWDKAEKEADAEIETERSKNFSSVDEFLADLKS